jgi:microcystin-dependent protein
MSSAAVSSAGGNQPVDRRPPYLVMNWCIATEGIYPSRG